MLDTVSCRDERKGHIVLSLFLDVVEQISLGMPVESFLEDEEFARTALSCHLMMDLVWQEMQVALVSVRPCQNRRKRSLANRLPRPSMKGISIGSGFGSRQKVVSICSMLRFFCGRNLWLLAHVCYGFRDDPSLGQPRDCHVSSNPGVSVIILRSIESGSNLHGS